MDIFSPIFKKSNGVDTAPYRQVFIGPLLIWSERIPKKSIQVQYFSVSSSLHEY